VSLVALLLAIGSVTVAAYFDLRHRHIPNWLTAGTLLLGVFINAWQAGVMGAGMALFGSVVGFALLLPFYALRGLGAGDVKLLAAVGALVGPQELISVALYGALVGGAMSLVRLATGQRLMLALNEIVVQQRLPARSGLKLPYGLAIAAGVYLSVIVPALSG
jgi:prepilin peptidase CpaA